MSSADSSKAANASITPSYDQYTAALEFEEFSFWDEDGDLDDSHLTREERLAFHAYLEEHYGAVDVWYCFPFIVIGYEEPPSEDERPFTIGGAFAIWIKGTWKPFRPVVGDKGCEDEPLKMDEAILEMVAPSELPPREVILHLANNVFPDCLAISVLWNTYLVELPQTSEEEHYRRLEALPSDVDGAPFDLRFYNGLLPTNERRKRVVKPKPKAPDEEGNHEQDDDTDYIKTDGRFCPGTMLSSTDKEGAIYSSVTTGILVEKGQQRRLTCSYHNWEEHVEKYPNLLGTVSDEAQRVFRILQGAPGTPVGFLRERIGQTDIGLAQLSTDIIFENKFMEMDYSPKVFLRSDDQKLGDQYVIDGFTTGKQKLFGYGKRYAMGRGPGGGHPNIVMPEGKTDKFPNKSVAYIQVEQGAYLTNAPIIFKKPEIRDRVCGSVILRCKGQKKNKESPDTVLKRGEVGGMMHWCDLQLRLASSAENYVCFSDTFDPLIEQNWRIVQDTENEVEVEVA